MDQIIMFFNENVGFVGGILSLVITFATVVYAFFTWRLADETKRLRMVHSEPLISITVTPYDFVMLYVKIIIENIGEGPAYNISFSFRDNIDLGEQKHLSDLNFLKQCKYLKPKQKIESYFSSYQQLKDVTFYITVHYENSIGTKYQEEFEFNLSDLE